jgi:hypothetical protein
MPFFVSLGQSAMIIIVSVSHFYPKPQTCNASVTKQNLGKSNSI